MVPDNLSEKNFVKVMGDKVTVDKQYNDNTSATKKKVRVTNPIDKTARRSLDMVWFFSCSNTTKDTPSLIIESLILKRRNVNIIKLNKTEYAVFKFKMLFSK